MRSSPIGKIFKNIEALQDRVMSLTGWHRRIVAMLLGATMTLALPPFHIWPLLILGLTALVWMIDGSSPHVGVAGLRFTQHASWSAFAVGWWYGIGFFIAGLYWISFSFLVDAAVFAWMIPFALLGLSATMALYLGLGSWVAFITAPTGLRRVLLFAVWWTLFEWLRGWAFTGFPWNLMGTVWTNSEAMIQLTALTGVYGLSLVTVLAATAPAALGYAALSPRARWNYMVLVWAVPAAVWIGGEFRLKHASDEQVGGVRLRLIQPNISQQDKWDPNLTNRHLDRLIRLSRGSNSGGLEPATHVIWPETATPLYLNSVPLALRLVARAAPVSGALLTGAPRQSQPAKGPRRIWNSLHIVTADGIIRETYDKHHLVPFGEYVPFKTLLPISALAGRLDFSSGIGLRTLAVPGMPSVAPLICYEAVFPGRVTPNRLQDRPEWLLNVTNDAWFGISSGPYQHFAATQLRAVEEGLPLVRVANTGITGITDAFGRVISKTVLNEEAVIDSGLPIALDEPTWFSQHGNLTFLVVAVLLILLSRTPQLFPDE